MQVGLNRSSSSRDSRIDWLRGLAMTCVVINHTQLSSLFSWFSYERLWVVTAAEVFVVLSGVVLGMVYSRRLARHGWGAVVRGLGRRAVFLYASFIAVTLSILALAAVGVDVRAVAPSGGHATTWFLTPQSMDAGAWRDVLLMRAGPWAFEIIGLYVCLVAAAVPCLVILKQAGWQPLIAASWALYLWHWFNPHSATGAGFELAFPLLAWQLLFVHGLAIGYYRDQIAGAAARMPAWLAPTAVLATAAFTLFAFCNPWTDGPSWLRVSVVSAERFTYLYGRYFALKSLGLGRLLNLAIALPVGYAALTRFSWLVRPLHAVFITLGRQSLGAFVLHVYALVVLPYLALAGGLLVNTIVQATMLVAIAAILRAVQWVRDARRAGAAPAAAQMAA